MPWRASREAFFAECDVVSVHLPLTARRAGIVTAEDLALMKPDALFVNTSRAGIVEPGRARGARCEAGRPGRAAVDVFETSRCSARPTRCWRCRAVTATPHLGYVERDVSRGLYGAAVDQVLAFAAGSPVDVVTPDPAPRHTLPARPPRTTAVARGDGCGTVVGVRRR